MAKSQTELMMQNTSYPHGQEIQSKQKLSTEHMKQVNAGWKLKFGLEFGVEVNHQSYLFRRWV